MKPGIDYIGVGVGGMIFNPQGQVFLSQRGPLARNERGCWEFPGGKVEFGDTLQATLQREIREEYGFDIEIVELLKVDDHILPQEGQHWVSPTYLARWVAGEPQILEPGKCSAIGWFTLDALPAPLSEITARDVETFQQRGLTPPAGYPIHKAE